MRKYLILLCLILFCFGCENKDEPYVNGEYYQIRPFELPILSYELFDLSEFEATDELQELYLKGKISFGEGCEIYINEGIMYMNASNKVPESVFEKARECFFSLSNLPFTIDVQNDYFEDEILLGGIKSNKVWFGMYDKTTKKLKKEWISTNEIERNYQGKNNLFFLDKLATYQYHKIDGGYFMILKPYGNYAIYIIDDEVKLVHIPIEIFNVEVYPWYDNSFLLRNALMDGTVNYHNFIYTDKGEFVDEFKAPLKSYDSQNYYPVSAQEIITFEAGFGEISMLRHNIKTLETSWVSNIEGFKSLESWLTYSPNVITKRGSLWEMEVNAKNTYGVNINVKFIIDIETGEITYKNPG